MPGSRFDTKTDLVICLYVPIRSIYNYPNVSFDEFIEVTIIMRGHRSFLTVSKWLLMLAI